MILKTRTDYHRLIVTSFCEFEKGTYGSKLNEAIRVYDEYPDPDFWEWMILNCDIKVHSLNFFLTEDGKRYIQEKCALMKADDPKKCFTNVRAGDKVGKDKKYSKKRLSVLDFIKDGEKKEN